MPVQPFSLTQFVTLVPQGGTPVRLADQRGTPYPTTGYGALVFGNGPQLNNVVISGQVQLDDGVPAAPALQWDTGTGLYSSGTGNIDFASESVRIGGFNSAGDFDVTGTISGTWAGSPIGVSQGGTGLLAIAANDLIVGKDANTMQVVSNGTTGQVLVANTGAPPSWQTLTSTVISVSMGSTGLTPAAPTGGNIVVDGVLNVAHGGTGATVGGGTALDNISGFSTTGIISRTAAATYSISSLSDLLDAFQNQQGAVIYRGASGWTGLPPGTVGQVLTSGGAAANPSWATSVAGTITVGTTPVVSGVDGEVFYSNSGVVGQYTAAQLTATLSAYAGTAKGLVPAGSGGTTNFLREDGTWAVPPGGGGGSGTVNAGTAGQIAYYATTGTAVSGTTALPNGTTATTQALADNSTKVATTAYVDTSIGYKLFKPATWADFVTGVQAALNAGQLIYLDPTLQLDIPTATEFTVPTSNGGAVGIIGNGARFSWTGGLSAVDALTFRATADIKRFYLDNFALDCGGYLGAQCERGLVLKCPGGLPFRRAVISRISIGLANSANMMIQGDFFESALVDLNLESCVTGHGLVIQDAVDGFSSGVISNVMIARPNLSFNIGYGLYMPDAANSVDICQGSFINNHTGGIYAATGIRTVDSVNMENSGLSGIVVPFSSYVTRIVGCNFSSAGNIGPQPMQWGIDYNGNEDNLLLSQNYFTYYGSVTPFTWGVRKNNGSTGTTDVGFLTTNYGNPDPHYIEKTANYTLTNADNGRTIGMNSASGLTLTVNTGLVDGFSCNIVQVGAGAVTFAGTATIHSSTGTLVTVAQYGTAALTWQGAADTYLLDMAGAGGGGSGTVTSVGVGSTGSSLTVTGSPITTAGTINVDLNLGHGNSWTVQQDFNGIFSNYVVSSLIQQGSDGALQYNSASDFSGTYDTILTRLSAGVFSMNDASTVGAGAVSLGAVIFTTSNINAQTGTTYTLTNADNGKTITLNNASAITVSLNTGLTAGFSCMLVQLGAGQVTVGGTGTLHSANGLKSRAQYSMMAVVYGGATDTYVVGGDTTT